MPVLLKADVPKPGWPGHIVGVAPQCIHRVEIHRVDEGSFLLHYLNEQSESVADDWAQTLHDAQVIASDVLDVPLHAWTSC